MVGLILVLHFGTFHLLSLGWRRRGVDASPVMRNPVASSSLSEFWGRRWNTAFHELATQFTFRPAQLMVGRTAATLFAFLVSGLIHELVISVPAHGGYGLPTGYFVLQGLGVSAERTRAGRRLDSGTAGAVGCSRCCARPARRTGCFLRRSFAVILPTLAAVGAI
jgi:D-alanyl-lipoteichoic acid acyltransferase DltB (MBOAT superfamily)